MPRKISPFIIAEQQEMSAPGYIKVYPITDQASLWGY
jgi:hypothetical protein